MYYCSICGSNKIGLNNVPLIKQNQITGVFEWFNENEQSKWSGDNWREPRKREIESSCFQCGSNGYFHLLLTPEGLLKAKIIGEIEDIKNYSRYEKYNRFKRNLGKGWPKP